MGRRGRRPSTFGRNGSAAAEFDSYENRSLEPATGGVAIRTIRLRLRFAASRLKGGRNWICGGTYNLIPAGQSMLLPTV
ncbi:MAG TPA: hypothetical protein VME23_21600 [Terracidiphilus sp.]|nr:hypothetical protein [Terracidiphilus sp.]